MRTAQIFMVMMLLACVSCQRAEKRVASDLSLPEGAVARVAISGDPASLDPRQARDLNSLAILRMLFDGLTRNGPHGHAVPAMAEEVKISKDLTTYTFTLREANWSNGDPVTAHDFAYAWRTVLRPDFPAPNAYQLYVIKGAKDAKEGTISCDEVGVRALDDQTLVVELEAPTPTFIELISQPIFFPIHARWDELHPDWCDRVTKFYVCNGPFTIDHWHHNDELVLTKNSHYWEADKVRLDGVAMTVQEDTTALMLFERGELDWIGSPLGTLPPDSIPNLKLRGLLKFAPAAGTQFFRFNTTKAPLDNVKMRQALSYAIDRNAIVEHIMQGNQQPATGLVPKAMGLRDRPYFRDRNIVAARRLFHEALEDMGITRHQLPTLHILYTPSERYQKIGQAVQQQWKHAFGIDIEVRTVESKVLYEQLRTGNYDIVLGSWFADYNDPINFLEVFKDRDNGTNNTGWENTDYKNLLEMSYKTGNSTRRMELLQDAEELLIGEMPIAPLFYYTFNYLKNPKLENVNLGKTGTIDFREARFVSQVLEAD